MPLSRKKDFITEKRPKGENNKLELTEIGKRAKKAAFTLAGAGEKKNDALENISKRLVADTGFILAENAKDIENAKKAGMSKSMLDRLTLDEKRIKQIAAAVLKVKALPEVLGKGEVFTRPNGLEIKRMSVPLGVVGIIYEARPNVTADAAVLCLKSGNAVILRGGSEAIFSNLALCKSIRAALAETGLPEDSVQVLSDTSRETAAALMKLNGYIDVLIPRGGAGLIKSVVQNATVPVIETGAGNCHVYVDDSADLDMALSIIDNAKTQRPSVCNAAENLLVHENAAKEFLPRMRTLLESKGVQLRGCEKTCEVLPGLVSATEEDFYTEYNDYILSVKVVSGVKEAVEHINEHSTGHSEAIVTKNMENADYFTKNIDSAAVYVNASTRFTDGEEFGFGAEIGISTQKLHARGPMGLEALTTVKYVVTGNGQIRQ